MNRHTIDVRIDAPYRPEVQLDTLRQAARGALEHQRVEQPCELVVVVTGDETLHRLNQRHRGVDAPTDVLAFPNESKSPTFVFPDAPGFPRYLGDVIISYPRAEAQAADAGNDLHAELQLLVVHGVLHLLGYDDETETDRDRMWKEQSGILEALGVEVTLPS